MRFTLHTKVKTALKLAFNEIAAKVRSRRVDNIDIFVSSLFRFQIFCSINIFPNVIFLKIYADKDTKR